MNPNNNGVANNLMNTLFTKCIKAMRIVMFNTAILMMVTMTIMSIKIYQIIMTHIMTTNRIILREIATLVMIMTQDKDLDNIEIVVIPGGIQLA